MKTKPNEIFSSVRTREEIWLDRRRAEMLEMHDTAQCDPTDCPFCLTGAETGKESLGG